MILQTCIFINLIKGGDNMTDKVIDRKIVYLQNTRTLQQRIPYTLIGKGRLVLTSMVPNRTKHLSYNIYIDDNKNMLCLYIDQTTALNIYFNHKITIEPGESEGGAYFMFDIFE